jgi:hypothetical protein
MGEKLIAAEPCIPLRRADLTRRDRFWRRVQMAVYASLAGACGPALPFEWILRRAQQKLCSQGCGFAVPAPLAMAHFGDALLVDIPTSSIHLRLPDWIGFGSTRLNTNDYFLGGGDWRGFSHAFLGSTVAREARELAEHGLDYRKTRTYANYLKRAQAGKPITRNRVILESPELIEGYFERFVTLFQSIQQHGVRRLDEVRQWEPELARPSAIRRGFTERGEKELGVAIGETGEIYRLPGGQHRTAIAMVLGVETLPVQIRLIHAQWLRQALGATGGDFIAAIKGGIAQLAVPQEGARRA